MQRLLRRFDCVRQRVRHLVGWHYRLAGGVGIDDFIIESGVVQKKVLPVKKPIGRNPAYSERTSLRVSFQLKILNRLSSVKVSS